MTVDDSAVESKLSELTRVMYLESCFDDLSERPDSGMLHGNDQTVMCVYMF